MRSVCNVHRTDARPGVLIPIDILIGGLLSVIMSTNRDQHLATEIVGSAKLTA